MIKNLSSGEFALGKPAGLRFPGRLYPGQQFILRIFKMLHFSLSCLGAFS